MKNKKKIKNYTIIRPDDWHVHLRDNQVLKKIIKYTSSVYQRAIVMPNLKNPITNIKQALQYKERILDATNQKHIFEPLITCYLTNDTDPKELETGYMQKVFIAAKLYFVNSTTNSKFGVTNIKFINNILERMQKIKMPLLIHGEIVNSRISIFDRETQFIDTILIPLRHQFPELKIVFEHISTKNSVHYIQENPSRFLAATITPHHLMFNQDDILINKENLNLYCFPILKRKSDQIALRKSISSGNKSFFLGSDSAPHFQNINKKNKINPGIFNAPTSLVAYATIFEEMNAMHHFENFCSKNGPYFYNLPYNKEKIKLVKKSWKVMKKIYLKNYYVIPFLAGKTVHWSIDYSNN